ncbi:MAG TPA: hypothetical protein VHB21_02075 [Minicystis sp.]|nr:hypothetical protein [Minicystis sp.]
MWSTLGAATDVIHALAMAAWVVGLPLLFVHRWPRASRGYAAYTVAFVVLSQGSQMLLGECFLTTIARAFWERAALRGPAAAALDEWFTVRFAKAVFQMTPSHRAVKVAFEALALVAAAGLLSSAARAARARQPRAA